MGRFNWSCKRSNLSVLLSMKSSTCSTTGLLRKNTFEEYHAMTRNKDYDVKSVILLNFTSLCTIQPLAEMPFLTHRLEADAPRICVQRVA